MNSIITFLFHSDILFVYSFKSPKIIRKTYSTDEKHLYISATMHLNEDAGMYRSRKPSISSAEVSYGKVKFEKCTR